VDNRGARFFDPLDHGPRIGIQEGEIQGVRCAHCGIEDTSVTCGGQTSSSLVKLSECCIIAMLEDAMTKLRYVHWQDGNHHLGYFEDYPDYITQGKSLDELMENLRDLYPELTSGAIPYIKKVDELVLA
jgi:predicted RNase H-like HicB family nuclease